MGVVAVDASSAELAESTVALSERSFGFRSLSIAGTELPPLRRPFQQDKTDEVVERDGDGEHCPMDRI